MTTSISPSAARSVPGPRYCGAVLVGGASTRMGVDKATLSVAGAPMAARVAAAMRSAGVAEVVAVGGDEAASGRHGLAVVPDRWPGEGPLGGVVTALGWFAARRDDVDAVVVAACDLPWLDARTIRALTAAFEVADPRPEVVVAYTVRREPLCAVWSCALAPRLEQCFTAGERAVHRALADAVALEVDVDPLAMRNVNRPSDLDDAPEGASETTG